MTDAAARREHRLPTGEDLAVLVPVLRRPHRVVPTVNSIAAATSSARVVFICDPDDTSEVQAVREVGADLLITGGNYAAKINAAVRATVEPLLFLAADDLHFHRGWFETAASRMTDTIGVVGTNDLCNPRTATGELSTHTLVARWYTALGTIDEPDRLLCEAYLHDFVDDEFIATAKWRGAYTHAPDAIVEHLHPDAGKAPLDDVYAGRPHRMRTGRRIYEGRRHLWT